MPVVLVSANHSPCFAVYFCCLLQGPVRYSRRSREDCSATRWTKNQTYHWVYSKFYMQTAAARRPALYSPGEQRNVTAACVSIQPTMRARLCRVAALRDRRPLVLTLKVGSGAYHTPPKIAGSSMPSPVLRVMPQTLFLTIFSRHGQVRTAVRVVCFKPDAGKKEVSHTLGPRKSF
jgi:hypothetical protein